MRKCIFIKPNGEECKANAMRDSKFCFTHNPDVEAEKMLAVSRGGSSPRKAYKPLAKVRIDKY